MQPHEQLHVHRHRAGLCRTTRRLREGRLTIGFLGGSITDPRPGYTWPEPVIAWFASRFPEARITVENAAIGATGSDLAVFRAERDIIERGCDLVFVEYAVNDGGEATEKRNRTREGLIRKLLAGDGRDLVLPYTFAQPQQEDMLAGRVPATIAEFEILAEHYRIGSVWMGLHALRQVLSGELRWEAWLPDGLHPQHRGSLSYAESVIAFLEHELAASPASPPIPAGATLPAPLNPRNWEKACRLPLTALRTEGPWALHRWPNYTWIDQVLATSAPGAKLAFDFDGRGLALAFDFGKTSAEFRYRFDGGPWKTETRERFDWVGDEGWFRISNLADDLPPGPHRVEIEVIHGGEKCKGTHFRLALVGIIR